MANELALLLARANLVAAAAILLVLALRTPVAQRFGAQSAYLTWMSVPLAALASLLPARRILVEATAAAPAIGPAVAAGPATILPRGLVDTSFDSGPTLLAVWLAGAAVFLALLAWRQRRFIRSLGRLSAEAGLFRAEAAGVGPALVGALAPRIVVPADFEARFSAEERALVIDHERTHLRRGDHLVNAAAAALQCLCWFNPLVHLAAFHLRLDQELACDAAVVAGAPAARKRYAEAMLKTQFAATAAPFACAWPARSAHPMTLRIAMLKAPAPAAARRWAGLVLATLLSAGAGVTAWAAQPPRIVATSAAAPAPSSAASRLGELLVEAMGDGDPGLVDALIAGGADVNHVKRGDGTPLIQAVRHDDYASLRKLIARGADVNKASPGDGNPLILAAQTQKLEMVTLLVSAGADVNAFVPGDETPLIGASRSSDLRIVRYLVGHGADPSLAVPSGNYPGHMRSPLSVSQDRRITDFLKSRGAR